MGAVVKCRECLGRKILWKRLSPVADDGELHTVRCDHCKGRGWVNKYTGKPVGRETAHVKWHPRTDGDDGEWKKEVW